MTTVSSKISLQDLLAEFNFIKNSFFDGVAGVFCVDSGKPGPTLGITLNTHGNEPSGLAVLAYFRHQFSLKEKMLGGKVFFVLNNLEATKQYFVAMQIKNKKAREEAKGKCRFTKAGCNFNRLPKDTLTRRGDKRYEVQRAQKLSPIWAKFSVGFDIHSMVQKSPAMIIACGGFRENLIAGFPVGIIIRNIDVIQKNKPAVYFYGKSKSTPMVAIEAGYHEDETSFKCATKCVLSLMRTIGMLPKAGQTAKARIYKEYQIDDSVMFPNKSYKLVKVLKPFERIKEGQLLACGNRGDVFSPFSGHALMGPKDITPDSIEEEVLFLSRPIRIVKI